MTDGTENSGPGWNGLRPRQLWLCGLAVLLLCAVAGVALLRGAGEPEAAGKGARGKAAPPVPTTPVPAVEPVELVALTPEDAVKINAAVPFSRAPNPAARPLHLKQADIDRSRSVDCLAAAAYYEAATEGDDGQRAVVQVVLNRLRHPAFPKSICGVVFQGAERSTGCQFTFTCDGALARTPSAAGWKRAREIADAALKGRVYKPVGYSTHYHTNWVVPYWSETLDKVVAVGTHLFFRWSGGWGRPPAFREGYAGAEPAIALIARLSPAHAGDVQLAADGTVIPTNAAAAAKSTISVSASDDSFILLLDAKASPASFPALALTTCGTRDFCKLLGWTDPHHAPKALPVTPDQHKAMSFSYLRNRSNGFEKLLWNCKQFPRPDPNQCMKG